MLPPNYKEIRANPLLETYQTLFVLCFMVIGGFLMILILGIVISVIFSPGHASSTKFLSFLSMYGLLFLIFITLLIATFMQRRYWKRIERGRMAAAGGDRSLLAVEQPTANLVSLQLPCKIELRMGNGAILLIVGMSVAYALLFSSVYSWLNDGFLFISPDRLHNFLELFAITAISMVIVMLALFLSPIGAGRQKVEVTEQGLRTRYGGKKSTVRWEDARLFAMYSTWGDQKNGSSITFELSSAMDIARWTWVLRPKPLRLVMIPSVPFEEYTRQMQVFHAFIVARTGLPLFDLREESTTNLQRNLIPDPSKSE